MVKVDDDIERIVAEHGYEAVEGALKKAHPQSKRGRPPVDDAQALKSTAWWDAGSWAGGQDIREDWSDNAVANTDASFEPEHNRESITRRIRRKLAGTARLERALRLMANLDNARRLVSRMLFVADKEALAVRLNERAKQALSDLE